MQRLNRPAHAPVGTAFFLFLGLAILPFSLRAAGVQVSFSPRLAAAMDAWHQIAEVFGASYQPNAAELSVVKDVGTDPSNQIDSSVSPRSSGFACTQKADECAGTVLNVSEASALKAAPVRRASSKSASRRSLPPNQVALVVGVDAITAKLASWKPDELLKIIDTSFERQAPVIGGCDVLKEVFKRTFRPIGEFRNDPVSRSFRVFVRTKRPAVSSSAKTAERKVFSALASVLMQECDRAIVTGMTTASPDHSEF